MKKRYLIILILSLAVLTPAVQAVESGKIIGWGSQVVGVDLSSGFIAISAGETHSLGIKEDGSIVAWGDNSYGQCDIPLPNSGFIAISAGGYHSLGIKEGGSIVAWGDNSYGQCDIPLPNSGFIAVSAGGYHSLGIKEDGSIVAWGYNGYGQCDIPLPNSGFIAISAGVYHSLGIKEDGSIVAWGYNGQGQCDIPLPNSGFIAISAGAYHSLGIKEDGSIVAWGNNTWGQASPPAGNDFVAIAAGYYHSLALYMEVSNVPPVAEAGDDQAVIAIDTLVQLDGSQSHDDDGDDITYFWTMSQKPDGSLAELSDPLASNPNFIADIHGDYVVTLVVTDVFGAASQPDSIIVSFSNVKPLAVPGGNQSVVEGDTVCLDGSGSYDDNGDELSYNWSIVSKPPESVAALSDSGIVNPSFIADIPGSYEISLIVNDGFIDSEPASVFVMAISNEDAASAELIEEIEVINNLDPEVFMNPNLAGALTNKINDVLAMIDQGLYEDALDKLQNDILKKTNGCAETGEPDRNDWIKTCSEQEQVYQFVLEAIQYLEEAMQ